MFLGAKKEERPKETKKKDKSMLAVKGENIETAINVTIEEAFYGATKKISLRATDGKMKKFSIKIPAGIRSDEKIRLIGQGKNGEHGGKNGDLLIKIKIDDGKKYKIKGCNLYTDIKIAPWEAVLGSKVNVEGIDGIETVDINKGMQSGDIIKIEGRGYKDGKGGRGDLIVEVKICIPKKLSEEEIRIYEKLKEISA